MTEEQKKLKAAWHEGFWKLKALEQMSGVQSIRRCLATSDETARRAMLCDDGRGVAGQTAMPTCDDEADDMGDQIVLGDLVQTEVQKKSNTGPLLNLAKTAILAGSGVGMGYLVLDYLANRPETPVVEDTNDVIFFTLDDPAEKSE